ncbi:restriction endonuclease subunit S [Kitasatospora acidiphila]|uniref:Restriction endonuclease subunit S n=1 Tax=Kitasatospora acidiphila TaxID=2567942 RepID=A0A540VX29_9ACTN|nr:restriction endonuclease subunit S [Kitasatospora acidiphila]TQF01322.1 restriction endonuclease subunit S [Kitasatospora acidiphila]
MTNEQLPAGWAWATVAEVGRLQLGRQRAPRYHAGPNMRPYLRVANVFEDRIDTRDVMSMNFDPEEFEAYQLQPGDVLLNEGQSPELLGRPAIYRGEPADACFTNSLIRFQAHAGVLPEWALTVFRAYMHNGRFRRESRITTNIAHLSMTRLKHVEFPVPPLAEQQRISDALDEAWEYLARARQSAERSLRLAEALREGLIQSAVVGSVRLQGSSSAHDILEEAGIFPIAAPPADLPELPPSWCWVRLGDLADVSGGVTKDTKKQGAEGMIEVPYLRVANVQRGHLQLDHVATIRVTPEKLKALRLERGDVLMNEGGDRDKLGRGWVWDGQIDDCIHQNHVFRARLKPGVLEPKLLSWFGNTWGRSWFELRGKQTTNLASLSLRTLKELPVPVPPLDVQTGLTEYISETTAHADRIIDSARQLLRKLDGAKKSLLQAAVTGRVVPQNPSDESADELLARLRAESTTNAATRPRTRAVKKRNVTAKEASNKELA